MLVGMLFKFLCFSKKLCQECWHDFLHVIILFMASFLFYIYTVYILLRTIYNLSITMKEGVNHCTSVRLIVQHVFYFFMLLNDNFVLSILATGMPIFTQHDISKPPCTNGVARDYVENSIHFFHIL